MKLRLLLILFLLFTFALPIIAQYDEECDEEHAESQVQDGYEETTTEDNEEEDDDKPQLQAFLSKQKKISSNDLRKVLAGVRSTTGYKKKAKSYNNKKKDLSHHLQFYPLDSRHTSIFEIFNMQIKVTIFFRELIFLQY